MSAQPADDPASTIDIGPRRIRVLVCSEATLLRESLTHSLREHAHMDVHGVVLPGEAGMAAAPDVVLVDSGAARPDEPLVLARIAAVRESFGDPPILLISHREDGTAVLAALRLRLRGFVPTTLSTDVLVAAIGLVLAGGTFIPEGALAGTADAEASDNGFGLTPRETEVLRLIRRGKPNKVIAHELTMSEGTVKVHVRSVMRKLRARNRTQLAFMQLASALSEPARSAGQVDRPAA